MHSKIESLYKFEIQLKVEDRLFVGSGIRVVDNGKCEEHLKSMNTKGKLIPVIPGSTLKGAVRQRVQHALSTKKAPNPKTLTPNRNRAQSWRHIVLYGTFNPEESRLRVERIFGSTEQLSHVFFTDATPEGEPELYKWRAVGVHLEPCVGAREFKACIECVGSQTFNFEMVAKNLPDEDIGLLLLALNINKEQPYQYGGYILIGRFKYRKYMGDRRAGEPPKTYKVGWCKARVKSLKKLVGATLQDVPREQASNFIRECISKAEKLGVKFANPEILLSQTLPEENHMACNSYRRIVSFINSPEYPWR